MNATIAQLSSELGIMVPPPVWTTLWPDFMAWRKAGGCPQLHWELPTSAEAVFNLPPECLGELRQMFQVIAQSEPLQQLAELWHYVIYHLPGEIGDNPSTWPVPEQLLGGSARLFALAMAVSGTEEAVENFRRTGVSPQVITDSLGYIGEYVRNIKRKRGMHGLESIAWLRNYLRANVFRLGRLTFRASAYNLQYRVYVHRQTGAHTVLCDGVQRYRQDGYADGTNDVFDPQAWLPELKITERHVYGYPVVAQALAGREPVTLQFSEWEEVLAPGDWRIEIHIAGGSPMPFDACLASYRQALDFFPSYYKDRKFKACTCTSWLLDPALPKILPATSNICKFQSTFHLLPLFGNSKQTYDLVFGNPLADPASIPNKNTLQQAIADYVATGNFMRDCGGYMLMDEVKKLIALE
ncbi:MAG: DUF5596 domain-containing protein [Verrucomicrobia bacterium]|nr:DUF5596 domain-containing protein [Verrucomicrobiota bacterium]